MSKQGFLHGTLILIGAGFITRILGFVYRIALSKIIGDEGMGLFQMAFPILVFALVITTAGIPIAISKLVSEAIARNEGYQIRNILITSSIMIISTSIVVTILIIIFAPIIASYLLTDSRSLYSLLGIAPIIPIVAISSVFRGYFQGLQQMSPYAVSTIIEQIVRIFTILFLAQYLLKFGLEYAAAGAMIGMVIGEFVGMLYLIISFKKNSIKRKISYTSSLPKYDVIKKQSWFLNFKKTASDILSTAVPVTTSRTASSLAYAVEPIVVAQSLALAGIATATSTALYGQLQGMAIPLIYFPIFITYALSISIIPAISEAVAKQNMLQVNRLIQQTIRLCIILGIPCAVLLYILAEPLALILYHNAAVANLLKYMAPAAVFIYIQGPLASILQGLDKPKIAMHHSILGAVVKTVLIFILASIPSLGILGVALAFNAGAIVTSFFNIVSIAKEGTLTVRIKEIVQLAMATGIMILVADWFTNVENYPSWLNLLTITLFSLGAYFLMIFYFSLITKEDLVKLPFVKRFFKE